MSLSPDRLADAVDKLLTVDRPRFRRLWAYYRNPMKPLEAVGDAKPYRQAQEWGLPARITGYRAGCDVDATKKIDDVGRKEVVIENDIAWRIETMVEYLFGKPLVMLSTSADPQRRETITIVLSRHVQAGTVMLLDSSRIEVMPLAGRSFHYKPLAVTGDKESGQVIGEYTLEMRNESAHGLIKL